MRVLRINFFLIFNIVFISTVVNSTEFVPVYMWGTSTYKASDYVPALHKISSESFKDALLEYKKKQPFMVVFAEETLSPEDFVQKDVKGETAFPELAKLRESSTVSYKPYVQNPLKALKHLDEDVIEVSIETFSNKLQIPKTNILIVDLNDAEDDEHRFDMLRRHDSKIVSIYNEILKEHENVLALYTSHHTSWVAPEETIQRNRRSLLALGEDASDESQALFDNSVYIYIGNHSELYENKELKNVTFTFTKQSSKDNEVLVLATGKGVNLKITFNFTSDENGYWKMSNATIESDKIWNSPTIPFISAPLRFSYHCGNLTFTGDDDRKINIIGLQVQPFFGGYNKTDNKFDDAYDCIGFTSIPIWSGLFVTFILLFIMTIGLTMMMDIKTMDRFDDAKGKTITINASE